MKIFSKYLSGRKEEKKAKNIEVNLYKNLPVHYRAAVTLNTVHLRSLPQNKDIPLLVCYGVAL